MENYYTMEDLTIDELVACLVTLEEDYIYNERRQSYEKSKITKNE